MSENASHKSGFVTLIGRPNVGKSTLMNRLIGQKIAITSNKPQTTRNRICGIVTKGTTQFVFVDTPGFHKARTKLGDYMVGVSKESIANVDATILGGLEVDEEGSLSNWIIPGKKMPGMGGAMDLVSGAENVIVITTHTDKKGGAKILKKCTLPLTAYKRVKWIITELAVIEATAEGLVLREVNAESSVEEVVAKTEATLIIPENVATF